MKEVEIKLSEGAKMPIKGEPNAMCYDCYAYKITHREDGKVEVDLGFGAKPPKGYGIRLIARSGLSKYWWTVNTGIGIGDEDYKQNYKLVFTPIVNVKTKKDTFDSIWLHDFPYSVDERCCQMEIYERKDFEFKVVEELSGEDRGGGFNSTGVK